MNASDVARLCEPAPLDHLVCTYDNEKDFTDAVSLFASAGITKKEAVILILTTNHADLIRHRLEQEGFNVRELLKSGRLVLEDAEDVLHTFLIDGQIDEPRCKTGLGSMIESAHEHRGRTRPVRLFGEMVDLIWLSNPEATLRLEQLWDEVINSHSATVLHGYGVGGSKPVAIPASILACHSHTVTAAHDDHDLPDVSPRLIFKLLSPCAALRDDGDYRKVVTIPKNAFVTLLAGDLRGNGVVKVLYENQHLQMLAVDLRTRGILEPSV